MQRLKDKNYAYPYEHIIFEYGGHLMSPVQTKLDKYMKANRKYPKEAEQYRKEHLTSDNSDKLYFSQESYFYQNYIKLNKIIEAISSL